MRTWACLLMAAALLAGCSAGDRSAPTPAESATLPRLVTKLVPAGDHAVNLEVHVIPSRDLGPAVLTVGGKLLKVLPRDELHFRLAPPVPPPHPKHSPYPLPRVLIEVFRIEAAARGDHIIELHLAWQGGQLSKQIVWVDR